MVKYGEMKHSSPKKCIDRYTDAGFLGNPDFYGLGIRIGIYLQWLGSLIANSFLPGDRRAMAGAYASFGVALLVAVLLLIFQNDCAFTAEMIVLLTILFGGLYVVLLPFFTLKIVWKTVRELELIPIPLLLPLLPISV